MKKYIKIIIVMIIIFGCIGLSSALILSNKLSTFQSMAFDSKNNIINNQKFIEITDNGICELHPTQTQIDCYNNKSCKFNINDIDEICKVCFIIKKLRYDTTGFFDCVEYTKNMSTNDLFNKIVDHTNSISFDNNVNNYLYEDKNIKGLSREIR